MTNFQPARRVGIREDVNALLFARVNGKISSRDRMVLYLGEGDRFDSWVSVYDIVSGGS